jgi:uncharacterized surface protein with fasciclin (FAS1) repeats
MKKKIILMSLAILLSVFTLTGVARADNHGKIAGKFFLQVEANGELWYIMPDSGERFLIRNPDEAMNLIELTGIGITNENLSHIPSAEGSTNGPFDMNLTKRLSGKFLIQVEGFGEAWYVNPMDMKRYYLGRPNDAFNLFASIAKGITNETALTIPEAKSIVDVAVEAGSFNTLVAAVQAAGLAETLDQGGPFTVFAPTDEAFAKLPEGTVESLLNDIPTLTSILLYHVVDGEVMAADVVNLTEAPTLNGKSAPIDVSDGVMVDNAKVTATDIMAVNGVIHVINTVILP